MHLTIMTEEHFSPGEIITSDRLAEVVSQQDVQGALDNYLTLNWHQTPEPFRRNGLDAVLDSKGTSFSIWVSSQEVPFLIETQFDTETRTTTIRVYSELISEVEAAARNALAKSKSKS